MAPAADQAGGFLQGREGHRGKGRQDFTPHESLGVAAQQLNQVARYRPWIQNSRPGRSTSVSCDLVSVRKGPEYSSGLSQTKPMSIVSENPCLGKGYFLPTTISSRTT